MSTPHTYTLCDYCDAPALATIGGAGASSEPWELCSECVREPGALTVMRRLLEKGGE